jgi:hypothetical protein
MVRVPPSFDFCSSLVSIVLVFFFGVCVRFTNGYSASSSDGGSAAAADASVSRSRDGSTSRNQIRRQGMIDSNPCLDVVIGK